MTVLMHVMWLLVGTGLAAWGAVVVWPRVGDDLEHVAEAYLRHRRRTQPDRLARRTRRQEVMRRG